MTKPVNNRCDHIPQRTIENIYFPDGRLIQEVREWCRLKEMSLSGFIREALKKELARVGKKEPAAAKEIKARIYK